MSFLKLIYFRESWGSRNRPRTDYRDYRGGGGRERYSPARTHDISPPMKRVRTEWYVKMIVLR